MKKIAIVGAGFAGMAACRQLAKTKNISIDLIDQRNHFLFQPLLYQVAMAGLNPSDIAIPIRKIFSKNKNVNVIYAKVTNIDLDNKKILFDGVFHGYDYIVLACGAKHFYFGNNNWENFAPGLKTIEQATEIRRRVLTAFELADKTKDINSQNAYLTFAIIGGGPTGVELAGAISEMTSKTLIKDFKSADLSKTRVILVESGPRILSAFPEELSNKAEQTLKAMGVEILKNSLASELNENGFKVKDTFINSKTILWAAGVRPAGLSEVVNSDKTNVGKLIVNSDLSLPKHKNIFVIGDQASFKDQTNDELPGIAPVAIQQGVFLAKQIQAELKGKSRKKFKYWDKGIMATIGRSKAILYFNGWKLSGFAAWLAWVFVHIVYLMKFKNKVFVFLQWMWSYFTFGRGARLIVQKNWRFYDKI